MCLAIQQMIEEGKEQVRLEEAEKTRAAEARAVVAEAEVDAAKAEADAAKAEAKKYLFLLKKHNIQFE